MPATVCLRDSAIICRTRAHYPVNARQTKDTVRLLWSFRKVYLFASVRGCIWRCSCLCSSLPGRHLATSVLSVAGMEHRVGLCTSANTRLYRCNSQVGWLQRGGWRPGLPREDEADPMPFAKRGAVLLATFVYLHLTPNCSWTSELVTFGL